jgi:hypothetical protein
MFDPETIKDLKNAIADCIGADQDVLDRLRAEIRPLRNATRQIQPRATTSRLDATTQIFLRGPAFVGWPTAAYRSRSGPSSPDRDFAGSSRHRLTTVCEPTGPTSGCATGS